MRVPIPGIVSSNGATEQQEARRLTRMYDESKAFLQQWKRFHTFPGGFSAAPAAYLEQASREPPCLPCFVVRSSGWLLTESVFPWR